MEQLDRAALLQVLSFLPPRDAAVAAAAGRSLAAAAHTPSLWAGHLERDFGLTLVRTYTACLQCVPLVHAVLHACASACACAACCRLT